MNFIVSLGIPLSITKLVSEHSSEKLEYLKNIFATAFKLILLTSFTFIIIILFTYDSLSKFIFQNENIKYIFLFFSLTIPFSLFSGSLDAYLKGFRKIKIYVKFTFFSSLGIILLNVFFIYFLDFTGAILALSVSFLLNILLLVIFLKRENILPNINLFSKFDTQILKKLLNIGFASLFAGSVAQISILIIRSNIIDITGEFNNGLYQSVFTISSNYFALIFATISTYSLPKVASLKSDDEIINEINYNIRFILLIITPLIILLISFKEYFIIIFFSNSFLPAENLFGLQFIGDFFKSIAWAIGLWLLPKNNIKTWFILDFILYLNYFILSFVLLNIFSDVIVIPIAYSVSFLIHFILNNYFTSKHFKFNLINYNKKILLSSFFILIFIIIYSYFVDFMLILVSVITLLVWFSLILKTNEKQFIKTILNNFFKKILRRNKN